ncbi:MAG: undecaprenyl/decaprenyl-phosphate alpha-N-acetylglucosaminyl 1-phosphate transferase [Cyanobacteria bacterium SIG28]|nr:undecaprenyl/decaprenyl-phosphate alpha-N-acetylglucosaminyl 1-phosphate transferase [Cyanobacteria bacterium SIG28]
MIIKLTEAHIIGSFISYLLGVFIVPFVIDWSQKGGLVDLPNERKIHTTPISRLGGVAIWLSTMLTFLFLVLLSYYPYGSLLSGILLGGSLMFLLGLIDDIYNLDAKFKLVIQLSIATIVYLLGVKIDTLFNPFGAAINLGVLSYPITLLWIVGITNAVNFIDGVDGLAGSVISVNSIALALIAVAMTPAQPITALIAFILAGSMLAFLTFNFNPAKIFMGDSGALFSGFLLATLSIAGVMKGATLAILLPFLVLAVPIMDITYSSLRRILKGSSPFVADAEHIHHKLLKAGFSQKKTVAILTSVAIVGGAIATYFTGVMKHYFIYIGFLILIMVGLSVVSVLTKSEDLEK